MKHKQTSLRWITLYFLLFIIMSACSSDHEVYGDEPKIVEPLTVNQAMDWYSRSAGMLTKQKSTTDNPVDISYKPFVHLAELFTDELWYAVESALDFGDSSLMIMTPEVANYADTQGDGIVKQELKLVVLRNRETGETYSFIMAVVPELDYMLRKGDELEKSSYFSPNSDLDGYIFFFTLSGELINGWFYEDGKVAGSINDSRSEQGTKKLVAVDMEVRSCQGYIGADGAGVECGSSSITVYRDDGNPSFLYPRVGVDIEYPNIYPNTGGGNNNNNSNKPRLPLKPLPLDDLDESTDPCQSMKNKMNSTNFIKILSDLKSLTGSNYEAGRSYTYDERGNYVFNSHNGIPGQPEINYNPTYISKIDGFIHSHYDGLLKTFSADDLVVPYTWFIHNNGIKDMNTFSLGLVTSEGTYFLFISDWTKYKAFGQMYGTESGLESLSYMHENFYQIKPSTSDVVSMQNLVKLLNDTNSGLTLMKDVGNNKYSIVTRDNNGNLKYTNCN